ncbi:integrating conjugative element protein, partial [Klebsiella pneumoniae]|nr:integrating conjugative element protein [Klebsiella pneumoniae]
QTTMAQTSTGQAGALTSDGQGLVLQSQDRILARIWGLTDDEMQRAQLLLRGPRAAFSVANLTPIEALGIHARNAAERKRYAE